MIVTATGGVQIIGRNSRFIGYFVTKTKKNTEKNTRRFKVNSSSIRQYTFCLKIQSINWGNPAFFDPSFAVLSAHIALYYRKQCFYERKAKTAALVLYFIIGKPII